MAKYGRGSPLPGQDRAGSHNRGEVVPNLQFHPVNYDVVILGGGYAGLIAALRLSAWTCPLSALLISETNVFTERVRLQEALAAQLGQRLPPLDRWLADTKVGFLRGSVVAIDGIAGTVFVEQENRHFGVAFDRCIYALGSATDVEHVPGVAKHAFRLDPGDGPRAAAALRKRLQDAPESSQVVIVGGGNTAVEAAAEIKALRPDFAVTMIAARAAGDFGKGARVETAVREQLTAQRIRIVDHRRVREVRADCVVSADEQRFAADICVWSAGLRSPPIARNAGLAVDATDRILVDGALRSISHPRILAVGDCARPLAPTGSAYRPSAFAALTSGAYAAASLVKDARGKRQRPFSFSSYGQGVAIGRVGVGFATYPDDGDGYLVFAGQLALRVRNLFVLLLVWLLRIERFWPGLEFFWIGRRRVSWDDANKAVADRVAERVGADAAHKECSGARNRQHSNQTPMSNQSAEQVECKRSS